MNCAACDKESNAVFCSKECYRAHEGELVFIGWMTCMDYEYTIVTKTRQEAETKLLKEWKRLVRAAGTQNDFDIPFSKIDFAWLNEWNGTRVEATVLGKINRP